MVALPRCSANACQVHSSAYARRAQALAVCVRRAGVASLGSRPSRRVAWERYDTPPRHDNRDTAEGLLLNESKPLFTLVKITDTCCGGLGQHVFPNTCFPQSPPARQTSWHSVGRRRSLCCPLSVVTGYLKLPPTCTLLEIAIVLHVSHVCAMRHGPRVCTR